MGATEEKTLQCYNTSATLKKYTEKQKSESCKANVCKMDQRTNSEVEDTENTDNVEFPKRKKGHFLKQAIAKKMQMLPDSELDNSTCSAKSSSTSGEVMV